MSVGYLVTASRASDADTRFESSFVAKTLWDSDGDNRIVDLSGPNWRVVCLGDNGLKCCRLWSGDKLPDYAGSFIYILGWCYRTSSQSGEITPADYRQILDRFRAGNAPVSDDYAGHFTAVVFDGMRKRIAVQPDRLAVLAAFFSTRSGEVAASNRAVRVANFCRTSFDGHSVLSMMRGTHIPFGRTLFAGVQRLLGASYLEIDLETAHAEVRRPSSLFVPIREISYSDAVDLYSERVKSAVKRLLTTETVSFDLTGGNDTRVIASAIENLTRGHGDRNYAFRVADPEGSPDVRVARRVSEACGWPLIRLDRYSPKSAPRQELLRAAISGDGNFPVNGCWERYEVEQSYAAPGKWKAQVGAAAGEIFRGFFYTHEMLNAGRTSNVNYQALLNFRTYASRGVNPRLFGAQAPTIADHDEVLMAPYRVIDAEGGSRMNTYKLDQMYVQRHCYRAGNGLSMLVGFSNVRLPFLSWELAGLGLSLPWKFRSNRSLALRVIGKLSPRLAGIPNEDGEPMRPVGLSTAPAYVCSKIPIAVSRARRVVRKVLGKSAGVQHNGLPKPQPGYFSVLENEEFLKGFVDREQMGQVLESARSESRPRDTLGTFYTLCTLELLCQELPALSKTVEFR